MGEIGQQVAREQERQALIAELERAESALHEAVKHLDHREYRADASQLGHMARHDVRDVLWHLKHGRR